MLRHLIVELHELEDVVKRLLCRRASVEFVIGPVSSQHLPLIEKEPLMLLLRDDQKCELSIKPLDAKGKAASIDGKPTWVTTDPTVAALTVSDDGLTASVAGGELGTAQVRVDVDADLGDGVRTLTGVLDVQVVGGEAITIDVIAGTPESQ